MLEARALAHGCGSDRVGGWHLFDLDPDYDVDLRDFAEFQNAFTGD